MPLVGCHLWAGRGSPRRSREMLDLRWATSLPIAGTMTSHDPPGYLVFTAPDREAR